MCSKVPVVQSPMKLSLADIKKMPPSEVVAVNQCSREIAAGFLSPRACSRWPSSAMVPWVTRAGRGVPPKTVLDRAGVQSGAKQVVFGAMDGPVSDRRPTLPKRLISTMRGTATVDAGLSP